MAGHINGLLPRDVGVRLMYSNVCSLRVMCDVNVTWRQHHPMASWDTRMIHAYIGLIFQRSREDALHETGDTKVPLIL